MYLMTNTTQNALVEMAAAVVAAAEARGAYMTDKMAVQIVRIELARMHAAFGPAETRAARVAASNAYLAEHGLGVQIRDLEAA